ncbi:serine hydrolase domain-containing protein [Nannocystaceae bacterium ST9]
MRSIPALALLVLGLLACGSSEREPERTQALVDPGPSYAETRETIHALAVELMKANEITGISLALVDEGEIVWATGWGWADVDRQWRAGPRTVYAVGSLSKPITAAAVMQAVEAGELALDDTLAELLPELELADDAESSITLGQLLAHRSGLPSDWFVHELSTDPPAWPAIVDEIRGLEPAAPPGHHTLYSNLGMALAGLALARERERDYETLVTETLLRPAGMRTAYFVGGPEPQPALLPLHGADGLAAIEHAASYQRSTLRIDPQFRLAPAGGLHASVVDLASFAGLLLRSGRSSAGEQLLAPASVDALLSPPADVPALDLDHRFGYGWLLDHASLDWVGRVAWHAGLTYYQHSRLIVLPDHGLAVAVASNSLTAGKALDTIAVETLVCALLEKHELEPPEPPVLAENLGDEATLDTFLIRHAGHYVTSYGLTNLDLSEGEVWLRARFGKTELEPLGPDRARIPGNANGEFGFARVEGLELLTSVRRDRVRRTGVRLPDPPPIPPAWIARLGAWSLVERPGEVDIVRQPELAIVDGYLVLQYLFLLDSPPTPLVEVLLPRDDRHARIAGLERGQGTVIEVRGEGSDERLWWAGREFRRPEH